MYLWNFGTSLPDHMVAQKSNDHQILLHALLYINRQVHIIECNILFNKWFSIALMDRDDSRTFCTYIMPNSKCVKSYNTKQHNTRTLTGLPTASQFLQHLASSWNLPQCMNWRALWLVGILHPLDYLVMVVWCLETILVTGNKPHIHVTIFWVRQDTGTRCCASTTLVHGNYCKLNWSCKINTRCHYHIKMCPCFLWGMRFSQQG